MKNIKTILFIICFLSAINPLPVSAQDYKVVIPREETANLTLSNGDIMIFTRLDEGFGLRSNRTNKNKYRINNKDLTAELFRINADKTKTNYVLTVEDAGEQKTFTIDVTYRDKPVTPVAAPQPEPTVQTPKPEQPKPQSQPVVQQPKPKSQPVVQQPKQEPKLDIKLLKEILNQNFDKQIRALKISYAPYKDSDSIAVKSVEKAQKVAQQVELLGNKIDGYIQQIEDKPEPAFQEELRKLKAHNDFIAEAKLRFSLLLLDSQEKEYITNAFNSVYREAVELLSDSTLLTDAEAAIHSDFAVWNVAVNRIERKLKKQLSKIQAQIVLIEDEESQNKLMAICKEICNLEPPALRILLGNESKKLISQLQQREDRVEALQKQAKATDDLWLFLFPVLVAVIFAAVIIRRGIRKKQKIRKTEELRINNSTVRRRVTTTIQYPSGIDEVKEQAGSEYYEIDINAEFFNDSAVEKIYFHKKCIEEIYEFLSNTLKSSSKIKEGGCYLLGRWEMIDNKYQVSYEHIVMPGDDAICKEYELNFGAKIGIRMGTALSSLREKTNRQYVLTAWLHTHPGLGIFLSAQDISVQNQLMDTVYRNRLTAIVIDILTPEINFVIFTPKTDGTMNNKADVRKEMSFEELYLWTKGNPQKISIEYKDYCNILSGWEEINRELSIELNNSAIIDIERLTPVEDGFSGFFNGFIASENGCKKIFITTLIPNSEDEEIDKDEMLGCLLIDEYFDIEKAEPWLQQLKKPPQFIFAYKPQSDIVICTPLTDTENYYLNKSYTISYPELKKWTRRKR